MLHVSSHAMLECAGHVALHLVATPPAGTGSGAPPGFDYGLYTKYSAGIAVNGVAINQLRKEQHDRIVAAKKAAGKKVIKGLVGLFILPSSPSDIDSRLSRFVPNRSWSTCIICFAASTQKCDRPRQLVFHCSLDLHSFPGERRYNLKKSKLTPEEIRTAGQALRAGWDKDIAPEFGKVADEIIQHNYNERHCRVRPLTARHAARRVDTD
jgi:hypothetical protein